jgi:hypothetical protein
MSSFKMFAGMYIAMVYMLLFPLFFLFLIIDVFNGLLLLFQSDYIY